MNRKLKVTIYTIFLLVFSSVFYVGCGKSDNEDSKPADIDPLSQDVIDKIDTIGDVTLEDQALIENLMKTYSEMTDKQKEQVRNYVTLKNDKEELDKLLESKAIEEEKGEKEEREKQFKTQRTYYKAIQEGIAFTKSKMKHPTSFVVKGVILYEEKRNNPTPFILISYEAENGLGNKRASVVSYSNVVAQRVDEGEVYEKAFVTREQKINGSGDSTYKKVEDNSYIEKSSQGNDLYCFMLDFNDYKEQGYTGIE